MSFASALRDCLPPHMRDLPDVTSPRRCPCGAVIVTKRPPVGGFYVWHSGEVCADFKRQFGPLSDVFPLVPSPGDAR
jgi:hypothetical protein